MVAVWLAAHVFEPMVPLHGYCATDGPGLRNRFTRAELVLRSAARPRTEYAKVNQVSRSKTENRAVNHSGIHFVTIAELVGMGTSSGEGVLLKLKDNGVTLVGRIPFDG